MGGNKREQREQQDDPHLDDLRLEGRNAVAEALDAGAAIDRILVKKGADGALRRIVAMARERGVVVLEVEKAKLDMIASGAHQGVVALCPAYEYAALSDILAAAAAKGEPPFIIVLDGIMDPRNLGAIIRSADACGAHGVVIPKRRAVGLTAVVSKTSAGALAHVPVARVPNIPRVIDELKESGVWAACVDMEGEPLYKADLSGPLALIVGGEGGGVGRLAREKCDFHVSIPMLGRVAALNASVAAGVLMYEVVRRRHYGEIG